MATIPIITMITPNTMLVMRSGEGDMIEGDERTVLAFDIDRCRVRKGPEHREKEASTLARSTASLGLQSEV
jgi:hypothetical protein